LGRFLSGFSQEKLHYPKSIPFEAPCANQKSVCAAGARQAGGFGIEKYIFFWGKVT